MTVKTVKKKSGDRCTAESIAAQIRELRGRMGVKQSVFAEHLGVKQITVSEWENGKYPPSAMALMAIGRMDIGNEMWWYEQAGPQFAERLRAVRDYQEQKKARADAAAAAGIGWDIDLLKAVVEGIHRLIEAQHKKASPEKIAEMIAILYEHCYRTQKWDSTFAQSLLRIA